MTVNHNDPKLVELNARLQAAIAAVTSARAALREALDDREGLLNDNQLRGRAQANAGRPWVARAASQLATAELAQAGAEDDLNAYYCEVEPTFCRRVDS